MTSHPSADPEAVAPRPVTSPAIGPAISPDTSPVINPVTHPVTTGPLPASAKVFDDMAAEESEHRHRLIE